MLIEAINLVKVTCGMFVFVIQSFPGLSLNIRNKMKISPKFIGY